MKLVAAAGNIFWFIALVFVGIEDNKIPVDSSGFLIQNNNKQIR